MSTRDEQLQMIEDCEKRQEQLDVSEEKFIDDITHYMERGGFLSVGQDDWLSQIWERVTEKG